MNFVALKGKKLWLEAGSREILVGSGSPELNTQISSSACQNRARSTSRPVPFKILNEERLFYFLLTTDHFWFFSNMTNPVKLQVTKIIQLIKCLFFSFKLKKILFKRNNKNFLVTFFYLRVFLRKISSKTPPTKIFDRKIKFADRSKMSTKFQNLTFQRRVG